MDTKTAPDRIPMKSLSAALPDLFNLEKGLWYMLIALTREPGAGI